jgi:glutamate-5-semialdehyde dehydrogenase
MATPPDTAAAAIDTAAAPSAARPAPGPPSPELVAELRALARATRAAQRVVARATADQRDQLLRAVAAALDAEAGELAAANRRDLAAGEAAGLAPALLDRLRLDERRLAALARDVLVVAALPDPLAGELEPRQLPNGLALARRRVPLGVVGAVYEARPNVTIDIAVAALKTANAVVLRGGREARHTNLALVDLLGRCLAGAGLPAAAVAYVDRPEREAVLALLALDDVLDVVVPRGGESLMELCREHSRVPLLLGGVGVVHIFVDASAELDRALAVLENAKAERPAVCNAVDTVLVHAAIAPTFLPRLAARLGERGVSFRADPRALPWLAQAGPETRVEAAGAGDFDREWLALTLGVAVVDDLDAALGHIARHGSGHSEAILTEDPVHAERFLAEVDAAAVYVNASTRFTDGGQFGMGVEVAVSTQRLHARGPVGPAELTSVKWVARGDYTVRSG